MELIVWATLLENILIFISGLITFFVSSKILLQRYFLSNTKTIPISPIIYFYLGYQFLWGFVTIIYGLYILILWRPETILYEQKMLYIIGLPSYALCFLYTVMESSLGIDRCLCIIFPMNYSKPWKKKYGVLTFILVLAYLGLAIFINGFIEIFFDDLNKNNCTFFNSILFNYSIPYVYILKLATIILDALIGLILFLLIKFYLNHTSNQLSKNMNKTIVTVIAATTFFEFVPNLIGQIVKITTNVTISAYLGPYSAALISINIALCSSIYYKTLKKTIKKPINRNNNVTVLPVSTRSIKK